MVGVLSNKIGREELKPGDHIYSWRLAYVYAHHGIYAGDGKVIHFTRGAGQEIGTGTVVDRLIFSSSPSRPLDSPCPQCGDQSMLDGVICSCLDCFLYGGELYIFQYSASPVFFLAKARGGTCTRAASDPPEDVLHRADILLKNGFGDYKLFKNNCEDFAIYCKTGLLVLTSVFQGRSGQASSFLAATNAVVSSPLGFLTTSLGWSGQASSFLAATRAVVSSPLRFLTTSLGRSGQASSFLAATSVVVSSPLFLTTSFPGLTAVGCGIYCFNRFVSDIGIRRDVTKVPVEILVALVQPDDASEAATKMDKIKKD